MLYVPRRRLESLQEFFLELCDFILFEFYIIGILFLTRKFLAECFLAVSVKNSRLRDVFACSRRGSEGGRENFLALEFFYFFIFFFLRLRGKD